MLIDKNELSQLLPHSGTMCLLDAVLAWDEEAIVCRSVSHRDPANPLRSNNRLAALHAFEYAAQAAAVHGGLLARKTGEPRNPGYLAALRDGHLHVDYLDDITAPLEIEARLLLRTSTSCMYQSWLRADDKLLAEVRLTVMLGRAG